jgi:hypothetical protein
MDVIERPLLIEGDYFAGAYGPSILLILVSPEAAQWLKVLFDGLADQGTGASVELTGMPEVTIGAALTDLTLSVVDDAPTRHLVRSRDGSVRWSCTSEEWRTAGQLVEPLIDHPGHQYLTSEIDDDAIVEVSRGEEHPGPVGVHA